MHLVQLPPRGLLCVSLVSDLSRRVLTSLGASGASLPAAPPIPPTPTHRCWQYYTRHFNDQPTPPPSTYDFIYMTCSQNYQSRKWGDFFVLVFFHLCLFSWVSGHLAECDFGGSGLVGLYPSCFLPNPQPLPCRRGGLCLTEGFKFMILQYVGKLNSAAQIWPLYAFCWCQSRFRLRTDCRISRKASLQL